MRLLVRSFIITAVAFIPLITVASGSGKSSMHSHTSSSSAGHHSYGRSSPGMSKPAAGTHPISSNKAYHPGVTHEAKVREADNAVRAGQYKATQKKKADEAQKLADQSPVKSVNTRISPLKPKAAKPVAPKGPFVSK